MVDNFDPETIAQKCVENCSHCVRGDSVACTLCIERAVADAMVSAVQRERRQLMNIVSRVCYGGHTGFGNFFNRIIASRESPRNYV